MKTKVVNKKTSSFDVYIGRGSKWGNPFRMKSENQRGEVIEKYEDYARQKFSKDELAVLVGKRLGCFCKPGWNKSRGVNDEIRWAVDAGMKIVFHTKWKDLI